MYGIKCIGDEDDDAELDVEVGGAELGADIGAPFISGDIGDVTFSPVSKLSSSKRILQININLIYI